MKSLFLKIFLSFWVAFALFLRARHSGDAGVSPAQLNLGGSAHHCYERLGECL